VSATLGEAHGRLPRRVQPELLDELPPGDPRAVRSRRDLRWVNRIMWTCSGLLRALDSVPDAGPREIVELGAGDGTMALRIARTRARRWAGSTLTLLDRQPVVAAETLDEIRALGWRVNVVAADALDWLAAAASPRAFVVANLFVHHFEGDALARLLAGAATHARLFACCEPRRTLPSLVGSRLLGLIGCNDVTRHDAYLSVHAGFRGDELSRLWDGIAPAGWTLDESRFGPFVHLFVARRSP
jgi:hypothetical protein